MEGNSGLWARVRGAVAGGEREALGLSPWNTGARALGLFLQGHRPSSGVLGTSQATLIPVPPELRVGLGAPVSHHSHRLYVVQVSPPRGMVRAGVCDAS